jgi:hypothetical protein
LRDEKCMVCGDEREVRRDERGDERSEVLSFIVIRQDLEKRGRK